MYSTKKIYVMFSLKCMSSGRKNTTGIFVPFNFVLKSSVSWHCFEIKRTDMHVSEFMNAKCLVGENCSCCPIYRLLPGYYLLTPSLDNNLLSMSMTKTWTFAASSVSERLIKRLAAGVVPYWKMERQLVFSLRAYDLSINQNWCVYFHPAEFIFGV